MQKNTFAIMMICTDRFVVLNHDILGLRTLRPGAFCREPSWGPGRSPRQVAPASRPGIFRDRGRMGLSEGFLDAELAAGMELRQLRYFVTLAEELHFGRAAEREHIVQSALSQQVQRLERELGVRLVERSTHRVALTAAGAVFLVEARQILAHADRAAQAARSAVGAAAPLRVGIIDSSYDSMPQILHEVQARYPGLVIHQVEASVPEQYQQRSTAAWTSASAGPRWHLRKSHRCCSARTRSASWCQPIIGSPTLKASQSPTWPPNRCCSPRKRAPRNSISSPSRCAGQPASPPPFTGDGGEQPGGRRSRRQGTLPVLRALLLHRRAARDHSGGRSPSRRPTTRGRCCGARPTTPATYAPSSAAPRRCPNGSAG